MCYSPEADVIAGLVVGAIGIDTVRRVDDRRYLALASVPIVLGAHQLIEAVAWWGLRGQVPAEAGVTATTTYLVLAVGVVPFLVPLAVMRAEPDAAQRRRMMPFVVLGGVIGTIMLGALATNGHTASIGGRYLEYVVAIPAGGVLTGLYFLAVAMPLLMSSHRGLFIFGMVNVPAFVLLSLLLSEGLISLWCVWAAVTSVMIAIHLRRTDQYTQRVRSADAAS